MLGAVTLVHRLREKALSPTVARAEGESRSERGGGARRSDRRDYRDLQFDLPRATVFKTCLRQIAFVRSQDLKFARIAVEDEVLLGEDGYLFALEVVCGLRSPLVGESEVLGQFKAFCSTTRDVQARWSAFRDLCTSLLTDAKAIRTHFLSGLGACSYGGLTRRHLRGYDTAVILGAGNLAREILKGLDKMERVDVVCRSRARAREIGDEHPGVALHEITDALSSSSSRAALIIAAPMEASAVDRWLTEQALGFGKILDLRGESVTDPLTPVAAAGSRREVTALAELFAEIRSRRRDAGARVASARREIAKRARSYAGREQLRPFGWEDLCA